MYTLPEFVYVGEILTLDSINLNEATLQMITAITATSLMLLIYVVDFFGFSCVSAAIQCNFGLHVDKRFGLLHFHWISFEFTLFWP